VNTFSDILRYVRIYRRYIGRRIYLLFALAALMAFTQGLGFTMVLPLLRVSQSNTNPEELSGAEQVLYDVLAWIGIAESLVGVLAAIVVIFLAKGALEFGRHLYAGYLQADLLKQLKTRFFDAYNGMTYRYFIDQNAGHFINVINAQVNRFKGSFMHFANALTKAVSALSFFAFAFAINWRFAVGVLVIGVGLLALFQFLNSYVHTLSRRVSSEMSRLNKLLVQSLQAFKYVISTKQTDRLRTEVSSSIRRLTRNLFRQRIAGAFTKSVKQPISVVVITGVILIQAVVLKKPLPPIFVALLLFHKGMQSVMSLQSTWQRVVDNIGSVEVVDEEMRSVESHQESGGVREIGTLSQGIEFRDVYFAYDEEDGDVLHSISVEIPANETVALVGKSGAGKSTLFKGIMGYLGAWEGFVIFNGTDISNMQPSKVVNSGIGYIPQNDNIFPKMTVKENILMGAYSLDDGLIEERETELYELFPKLEDRRDQRASTMSGGEQKMIAVARAIVTKPDLILFDEPSAGLMPKYIDDIFRKIDVIREERETSFLMIEQNIQKLLENTHRTYVLREGKIHLERDSSELLESDDLQRAYLGGSAEDAV